MIEVVRRSVHKVAVEGYIGTTRCLENIALSRLSASRTDLGSTIDSQSFSDTPRSHLTGRLLNFDVFRLKNLVLGTR